MGEDFDNHRRIFDDLQAAAAVRAVFDVEDPFEQPGLTQARRRVIACGRGCSLWRTGDDFTTQLCVRREHAMEVNLGMAVALEEGLVVPVIQGADRLTLEEIARQSRELAGREGGGE